MSRLAAHVLLCVVALACVLAAVVLASEVSEVSAQAATGVLVASLSVIAALAFALRKAWRASRMADEPVHSQTAAEMDRLRQFVRLADEWYWEQDASYRFTWRSVWHLDNMPVRQQDFLGKTRWELANCHSALFWKAHKKTLDARLPFRNFEYQFQLGGRPYWMSVSGEPFYSADGAFAGYRGTCRNVTREKAVEEALRTSEERFEEIVNLMPVSLFVKDAQSRVTFMNSECERQWGVRLDEVRGTDVSTIYPPEQVEAFLAADRRAFDERRVIDYEETVWHAALNARRNVRTWKKPVFDNAGQPRYLIGIRVDVTERIEAEERLRASEESLRELALHQSALIEEERKRIARDIHDDLGQNLLALRIETSRLAQRAGGRHRRLQGGALSVLHTIDETIRSVRQIINNLRPAVLDLGLPAALEWQVKEFAKHSAIACTQDIRVDENTLDLSNDYATALFRVLQESLTNAQRHSGATKVHVSLHCEQGQLVLSVADNGVGGVGEGEFQRGFGIQGMTERVRMLGGDLVIDDGPGGGTMLTVVLPLPQQTECVAG